MEISDLFDKGFKLIVIKMLTQLRRTMYEQRGSSIKKQNIRKYQTNEECN